MAIKKSDLYSKLWASCDELRGGMDASQYKDYVLVLLFIKYISDKYAGQPFAPIQIPEGASFADMVALKGRSDIGDQINKKIVRPLEEANRLRIKADFNDDALLGQGKEKVDKLTNLIGIFESKDLDFSKHRADGDDILGDAYEYLMRHFATESGKSKGQFYTPAEVSRVMAQVLGIARANTSPDTTVYDPTCGSGSLLLKVAEAAPTPVSVYGQEKEEVTSGLARMNMILHHNPGAVIEQGNTLADPKFLEGDQLKTFDYVVANPPFSDKRWSNGLVGDAYGRFDGFGTPPDKQGDYAYLLHIIRSLKPAGRAACILPHGVLFRGNAEAEIRRSLVRRGLVQAIIGLPANLFYGTGIPACILVIDKAGAAARVTWRLGIFMIDAAQGCMKDGPKNRLRERDIHRIVDTFTTLDSSDPRYARLVGLDEIEKNDFNLNLPRYIDSSTPEDQQDIDAHLNGGIPEADVQALGRYWAVCPQLRAALFTPRRPGYLDLAVAPAAIKPTIHQHPEFLAFTAAMGAHFDTWRTAAVARLKSLDKGSFQPKDLVRGAEGLLDHYAHQPTAEKLIDPYAVYQHLMDYWAGTMQDDAYLIAEDGWQATPHRLLETRKNKDGSAGKTVDKGWACDLCPKALLVQHHFAAEQAELDRLGAELDSTQAALTELEEEHSGDDAVFAGFDKINDASVKSRIKEIGRDADAAEELAVLKAWLALSEQAGSLKKRLKALDAALDAKALARYATLTPDEVKTLVVDHKWMAALRTAVHGELDRVSQALTGRVKELAERYGRTMPEVVQQVEDLAARVAGHLAKVGSPGVVLPWQRSKLCQLGIFLKGSSVKRDEALSGDLPCVRYGEIYTTHSDYIRTFSSWISPAVASSATLLRRGDLLFAGSGETKEEIGKCVAFLDDSPAYAGGDIVILRPTVDVHSMFLGYLLNTPAVVRQKASKGQSDAVVHISAKALGEVEVELPEPSEQTAIAKVLSDMDTEITALESRLTKARALKQAMAQALLTGRIRLAAPEA